MYFLGKSELQGSFYVNPIFHLNPDYWLPFLPIHIVNHLKWNLS